MKKIILLSCLITIISVISGCNENLSRIVRYNNFNFTPYLDEGFAIYVDQGPPGCVQIGTVGVYVKPAKVRIATPIEMDGVFYSGGVLADERISKHTLIKFVVDSAMAMGANGIVNFRCQYINQNISNRYASYEVFDHYYIEGVAVKIPE